MYLRYRDTVQLTMKYLKYLTLILILFITTQSCVTKLSRFNFKDSNSLINKVKEYKKTPYIKAHLVNGDICLLNEKWYIDSTYLNLIGMGVQCDYNRNLKLIGSISVPLDSVAIYEVNERMDDPDVIPILALIMCGLADLYFLFALLLTTVI